MPGSEDDSSSSLLAKITDLLDSNVKLTRAHLITSKSDIPAEFIAQKVRIRSYVEAVGTRGIVHVQHRPFLNIVPKKWRPKSHVQLEVALVDITPQGGKWLQDTINHKIVWFQPLSVIDTSVQANILFRKYLTKQSVNVTLVGQGICKIKDLTPEQLKSLSSPQEELLKTLLHHQKTASEKQRGMWKIQQQKKTWTASAIINNIVAYPIHLWRKMRRKSSK
ncbi:uncharacterized protein LOC133204830 isoform X2 [Saccostrea echinata]|uniref:uncharacterized protein LOC133204830 isoform X2 n=1 Tax=Saccostrea echinata TaxID=191078 RepID=UPI002A802C01|nr:uncharacterized protein LOC133204830 isoform X2 [Saccostrea echinata]